MAVFLLSLCTLLIWKQAHSLVVLNRSSASTHLANGNEACFFVLQTSPENITSPGYPNRFPDLADCRWTIEIPNMRQIHLQFTFFDLPDENSERQCDTAYVLYGTFTHKDRKVIESGRLCGRKLPRNFTAYGSRVWVLFISHWLAVRRREEQVNGTYGGFLLQYRAVFETSVLNGSNATLLALGVVLIPFFLAFPVYHCVRKMRDTALRERRDRQVHYFREMIDKKNKSSTEVTMSQKSTSQCKNTEIVSILKNRDALKLSPVKADCVELTDINNNELCLPSKNSLTSHTMPQPSERQNLSSMDSGNSTFDADIENTTTEQITCIEMHMADTSVFTYESIYESSSESKTICDHGMGNSRASETSSASPIYANSRMSETTSETELLEATKKRPMYSNARLSGTTSETELLENEKQNLIYTNSRVSETTSETELLETTTHNLKQRGSEPMMSMDAGEMDDIIE